MTKEEKELLRVAYWFNYAWSHPGAHEDGPIMCRKLEEAAGKLPLLTPDEIRKWEADNE